MYDSSESRQRLMDRVVGKFCDLTFQKVNSFEPLDICFNLLAGNLSSRMELDVLLVHSSLRSRLQSNFTVRKISDFVQNQLRLFVSLHQTETDVILKSLMY